MSRGLSRHAGDADVPGDVPLPFAGGDAEVAERARDQRP